jgi:periplasmic protein TonB
LKLTLSFSAAIHLALIALLVLVPAVVTVPRLTIDVSKAVPVVFGVSVVFAPPPAPPPSPVPQPVAQPALPPEPVPPPPPPQAVQQPPAPPAPVAEVPMPPPKAEPKPAPKPRPRPQPVQTQQEATPQLPLPLSSQATPPQVASIPPPPAPTVSAEYSTLLRGWLESHKRYPEEARQRGEQGRAILRFRVDRYGRVLDYAVVSSSGYADLDHAAENMMRGATMPPFPPSMTEPEIEVSVQIRFGLAR